MKLVMKVFSVVTAILTIASALCACMPSSTDSVAKQSSVTIMMSKNKLAGSLSLNSRALNTDITNAALCEGKIAAVELDGNPYIISERAIVKDANNKSAGRTRQIATNAINAFSAELSNCSPRSEEIDIISGINRSVSTLTSSDAVGKKVLYILSCGLSTTGILNMTTFNIFETNIELLVNELAEYVKDLSGIEIKWLNLGDVNASIQKTPDNSQLNILKHFYQALIEAKGGTVEFLNDSSSYTVDTAGFPNVTPVNIPSNKLSPQIIEYKLDDEKVSFQPDTAILNDEKAAYNAISKISKDIICSENPVTLIGSTASWGSESSCLKLAEDRCLVVKDILINQGVDENKLQIVPIGRDKNSPLRVSDIDKKGNFVESEGKKNRFVYITSAPESVI